MATKPHKRSESTPKSILIIRLSAIGDNVMATPLIRAIRRRYPDVAIDWLVQPESRDLVSHHPELRRTLTWPTKRFKQLARAKQYSTLFTEWSTSIKAIRHQRYDWVIDTQGLLKSGIIAKLSGARYIVGCGSREGAQCMVHDNVPKIHGKPRISSEYLDIAEFLGLPTEPFAMELGLPPASDEAAGKILDDFSLHSGFIALFPFTTRPQKHWIEAHWIRFIDHWWAKTGIPAVILGGPGDKEASSRIMKQVKAPASVINLASERFLSIPDAAALIGKASLSVGVDTGMTHMSIAHRRPTVCLFGSTIPYTDTQTPDVRILFENLPCVPCRKNPICEGRFDCMRQLMPEKVLNAALELIHADFNPVGRKTGSDPF